MGWPSGSLDNAGRFCLCLLRDLEAALILWGFRLKRSGAAGGKGPKGGSPVESRPARLPEGASRRAIGSVWSGSKGRGAAALAGAERACRGQAVASRFDLGSNRGGLAAVWY